MSAGEAIAELFGELLHTFLSDKLIERTPRWVLIVICSFATLVLMALLVYFLRDVFG